MLNSSFEAWHVRFVRQERLHRRQETSLLRRMEGRLRRTVLKALELFALQANSLRRLTTTLQRVMNKRAMGFLRQQTSAFGKASGDKFLAKQKAECERLIEQRARASAERTAKALLHLWRCGTAAEHALMAQRQSGARALLLLLNVLMRAKRQGAIERWRAKTFCCRNAASEEQRLVLRARLDKLERVRQGSLILQTATRHRERLALCRALHGSWRTATWQSVVRSVDASASRELRRLRADGDALKSQLEEERKKSALLQSSEAEEANRNNAALEETSVILREVRQERRHQAEVVESLRGELRQEARVMEALRKQAAEVATLRGVLQETHTQSASFEADKRAAVYELGIVRSELRDAERKAQAQGQQAQALQQQVSGLTLRTHEAEHDVLERAARMERDMEERAWKAEQKLQRRLDEQTRASELQASMAEEQERSINYLEEVVKEQGNQLRHERRERSKSAEQLRTSASLTESKSVLLQEQVSALRAQLQREQAELRASERVWAGDRAALLVAARSEVSEPGFVLSAGGAARKHRAASRTSSSPHRARMSSVGGSRDQRAVTGGHGGHDGHGNCPWHGSGRAARMLTMEG